MKGLKRRVHERILLLFAVEKGRSKACTCASAARARVAWLQRCKAPAGRCKGQGTLRGPGEVCDAFWLVKKQFVDARKGCMCGEGRVLWLAWATVGSGPGS